MPTRVMTDIQVVAAGLNYDIQPAAGVELLVTHIGSSVWVGVPPTAVPQVNVGLFDGVLGPSLLLRSVDVRGWNRRQNFYIDHSNYLRLNNPGLGGANISFSAMQARAYGTAPTMVISDIQTVAAGLTYDLQPAAGIEEVVTDVGSDLWIGAAPNGLPDVSVTIFDGTIGAEVMRGADARGWDKELELYLSNTNYLRFTNTNAAQANISFMGKVARSFGSGAINVRSDVATLGAGANWDIQPPAGEEWKINDIGGATAAWIGVSPAALPGLTVSLFDGTNASVLMTSTDIKGWMTKMEIYIDNTNYLRITDAAGGGQTAAISAMLARQYS